MSFGHAGDLGRFALGEKQVDHCARLGRQHAVGEQFALARGTRLEVHRDRRFDRIDARQRRARAAHGPRECRSRGLTGRDALVPAGHPRAQIACFSHLACLRTRQRECHRVVEQVAGRDLVDDAFGACAWCRDELSFRTQLERRGEDTEPRQPLCSTRARDDAERHFGLTDLGTRNGHAVVTGHGELQAAAQGVPVNGRHEWLRHILDVFQPLVKCRGALE